MHMTVNIDRYIEDMEQWNKTRKENENLQQELQRKDNIINECAEEILKELEEYHHLSYGVALSIKQKLLDYKELENEKI